MVPEALTPHRRYLSIHEYQSQDLLRQFEIPVPRGELAVTPNEVASAVSRIGSYTKHQIILKSQILAGGRGKGTFENGLLGGIQHVRTAKEGKARAGEMLDQLLVTKQTSSKGLLVNKLYVMEGLDYVDEFYLAMTIDRSNYCPAIVISRAGGVDIETTAREQPKEIHKFGFTLSGGITRDLISRVTEELGFTEKEGRNIEDLLKKMLKLFKAKDATLLEINPLVRTAAGDFICLDAKFNFDNAAGGRQKELFSLRDKSQELDDEVLAERYGLVYIRLDGNIGNVVNGAGLAMATNDAISLYGGKSANFLDAGGQATKETMQKAFQIILDDPRVKVILVNIYGGIIRCNMIAESIIAAAAANSPLRVPLVVRLQGTNSEEGMKMIEESGLGLLTETEFGDAAQRAVELARNS
ncbi:succinyl-CoA synthetase beta chain [Hyaloscypha variabilis F]|uniref:Succinate--CoA ligase [ADP-forming] subunit beta, mitochondrial n=1 Tax=Hyaloscypha variabilis (strain UAMH 11265 / GT02V1 / F) TaxID=1149755 RepID=A0A2J6RLS7_HYAVF|nr:succinyl-CoA synthetase beta chain [Hyaloscypha variabilis F]